METTLKFLKQLAKNNQKEWFDANRKTYETAKTEFEAIVKLIIEKSTTFDKELAGVEAKKCMFRINRDVRFSKDKSPYKTNMGASINPGGKKEMGAGYYIHIEPGKSFLAGGCYMPEPAALAKIRQEIDYHAADFKKVLNAKDFKTYFRDLSQDDKLKTAPKGYPKDHPDLNLLQHKHFIAEIPLQDSEVLDKNFPVYASKVFKAMYPLNQFLRKAME
ncbi:MAG: hypothetical protein K0S53_3309 [Bacteroidetes bacterium]|jgi:uncharacterized protein (TIGR02453 family)|nr:hypothetical protein [Bacteroidota bacterium]MDF2450663.1 hypothetical protein [Bacteroidota bacterium]